MDVHRCRFVPYPSSTINALAFSHPSSTKDTEKAPTNLRLAIGRANGNIEIWNPQRGRWVQEIILRGGKDRSIEALVWTHDLDTNDRDGNTVPGKLRLFSVGYSTVVTEWDLALGKPVRHSGGNYGEIWCMAVQPRWQPPKKTGTVINEAERLEQHIVVGCADGTLVLHSTADEDLRFLRTLARPSGKKSRVLSVSFLGRDRVVAGYADSTIRVYDARSGKQIRSMSLGVGVPGGPSEVLVWCVKGLPDGGIVSGDSTGEIKFWDGKTFTLLQKIKSHKADVLTLAVSVNGRNVFSGGMDRRTVMYKKGGGLEKESVKRWAEVSHQRLHVHDVKIMATFESMDMSVVASGGVDTTPIILPLKGFGREHHLSLPTFPNSAPVQSAPRQRLIMSWWDREVQIWRIEPRRLGPDDAQDEPAPTSSRNLVARIMVKGEENITSVSISKNGALLAVATVSEVKLFHLKAPKSARSKGLRVQKINCPDQLMKNGSKLIEISPDGNWLMAVRNDNSVHMHRIKHSQDSETRVPQPRVLNTSVMLSRLQNTHVPTSPSQGTYGPYDNTIVRAAWSSDSRILVVGDLSGSLDSWVLEGHEDPSLSEAEVAQQPKALAVADSDDSDDDDSDEESHPTLFSGQHWIRNPKAEMLPRLTSFPLILSFRSATSQTNPPVNGITPHPTRHNPHPHSHELPKGEDRLLVLTSLHQIYEFYILTGALTEWSRRNHSCGLPEEFQSIRERAINCVWNVNDKRQRIWLYGSNWLWMFDLSQDLPINVNASEGDVSKDIAKAGKKRKRRLLAQERKELRKNTSGAGSKIADEELNVGLGNKMRKLVGVRSEENEGQWISLEPGGVQVRAEEEDGYDTDLEEGEASALVRFRRGENGQVTSTISGEAADSKADSGPAYWHTFKYRPILAIVPLEEDELDESGVEGGPVDISGAGSGVEVALVERPLWDLDLPPKYHGDQEWNPEK